MKNSNSGQITKKSDWTLVVSLEDGEVLDRWTAEDQRDASEYDLETVMLVTAPQMCLYEAHSFAKAEYDAWKANQGRKTINTSQSYVKQCDAFSFACSTAQEHILEYIRIYYGDDANILETIQAINNYYDLRHLLPETFDEDGAYDPDGEYDESIIDFVTADTLRECRDLVCDALEDYGVEWNRYNK